MRYQLGLYEKSMPNELSIPEKLAEAKAAGFDYLELSIDESDEKLARLEWEDKRFLSIIQAQLEVGLPIRSICLSGHRRFPLGHPDPVVRAQSLRVMQGAIRVAQRLGARIIQLAGYDVYYEPSTEKTRVYFAEGLRSCTEMAAQNGTILAFETMETSFMDTASKAMQWVLEINSPYLQVYPDIGNITNAARLSGGDVWEDILACRGHLAAVHMKESAPGIYRDLLFGEGEVDFPRAAEAALEGGARMFVGEFWYFPGQDWRKNLHNSCVFLRNSIDMAVKAQFSGKGE